MKNTALKLTGAAGAVLMLIAALSLTGTDLPRENGPSSPSSSPHSTSSSGFSPSPTSGRIRQRPTVLHRIVHRNAGSNGRTDGGRILSRGGFYISLPSRRGKLSAEQAIRRLRHILRDHGQYGRELLFRSNDHDHHRPHHDQPLRHAVRQDYSGVLCRLVLLQGLYAG